MGGFMWKCSQCGEEVDDTFNSCWSCLTQKDGKPTPSRVFRLNNDMLRRFVGEKILISSHI